MHLPALATRKLALVAFLALAMSPDPLSAQVSDMHALDGEWIYVEDRTEGRALEQLGPPMSTMFSMRIEEDAVILVSGHGSGHRDVVVALDGSVTEIVAEERTTRYRGGWEDGRYVYQVDFVRGPGAAPDGLIRRAFQVTPDGLLVSAWFGETEAIGLYRHAEDIAMPAPISATIGDMAWLVGAWVGSRSSGASIEERWSPPLGGAMLGLSRTVSRGRMSAFEFLRIVERDGGLIYIAQPGGNRPTEFVLTELTPGRAVFDNPRHNYPKRIVYELSAGDSLVATIGFMKGGTPGRFEYQREGN